MMDQDLRFHTVTMARVYAGQGHWEKAAEIYRYLLRQEPGRSDLVDALAEVEKKMQEAAKKSVDDLVPLFQDWIDLTLKSSQIRRLRKLRRRL
ncbi:MAG: hypothetical protein JSW39_22885 [Desulfobacterales bacterium]|nr:MAG: hypothetical protein JSW39_22885 [Desulfobacterales bacterium]